MWSVFIICRNHLSFFIGKGAYAKVCKLFPAMRDKLLHAVLCAIPRFFDPIGSFSYTTPVTYGCLFFITYLIRFNSLRATLIITLCPLLFIKW
jgi:hypothetical protein